MMSHTEVNRDFCHKKESKGIFLIWKGNLHLYFRVPFLKMASSVIQNSLCKTLWQGLKSLQITVCFIRTWLENASACQKYRKNGSLWCLQFLLKHTWKQYLIPASRFWSRFLSSIYKNKSFPMELNVSYIKLNCIVFTAKNPRIAF